MQVSGNSSRQRESGETSSWVALILWKWSWVTGMTLPLGQVKKWAFLVVHYNWDPCRANIKKWFLFGSTWSKQKLKRWINDRGDGNQSAPTGCHRCHFAFSPFDLGTAFTHFSILELLAAEHFTFVITSHAFIISFAFISKNIPSIKIVSSFFQIIAKRELKEPCLFNLAWKSFYFTSRN